MNETQDARNALIGGMLLGRYRVVRELAKGGMGVVYLARAEGAVGFVKPVVVKLILPEHSSDERFLRMFAREAQIVSQLRHPSVVDVLEFAEQNGAYVMVLEYVRGHHLGQWRRYLQLTGRRISIEIAVQITIDVLDALHHAHTLTHPDGRPMQIVHRDVSPSNILLDEDGRARLLDFGVARMRGGSIDYQTQVTGFVGKLTYTAPEIFEGNDASPQSDMYSCAVVLHETLLGYNVFKGENQAETMQRALMLAPAPVASERDDVPAALDAILRKALAKAPSQRYATCRDFSNALRELLPVSESEMHVALAALLKNDFGPEMAELLGIESLADREEAWRRIASPRRTARTASVEMRPDDNAPPDDEVEATRDRRPGRASGVRTSEGATSVPPGRRARGVLRTVGGIGPSMPSPSAAGEGAAGPGHVAPAVLEGVARPRSSAEAALQSGADGAGPHARVLAPTLAREVSQAPMRGMFVAVIGVVALAVAAIVLRHEPGPDTAARVGVVTARTPPAAAPAEQAPAQVAQPSTAVTPRPDPGTTSTAIKPKPRTAPAPRTGPDPVRLTQAFREQQSKIEACFVEHAKGAVTQPEIQVEFDLEASGRLKRARVLPRSFASTPLGGCVARVAAATRFPKQGRPVSFTIPVHTSRGR